MTWIVIGVLVIIALAIGGVMMSKGEKKNAPKKLQEAKDAYEEKEIDMAYEALSEAFYVPLNEVYDAEDAKIALEVVELLEKIGKENHEDYQDVIDKIKPFLNKAAKSGGKVPDKFTDAVEKLLEEKTEGEYVSDSDSNPGLKVNLESTEVKNGGSIKGEVVLTGSEKTVELNYFIIVLERYNKDDNEYEEELGSQTITYFAKRLAPGDEMKFDFELFLEFEDFNLNPSGVYRLMVELNLQNGHFFDKKFDIEVLKEDAEKSEAVLNDSYLTDQVLEGTKVHRGDQDCRLFNVTDGILISWGDMISMRDLNGTQKWKKFNTTDGIAVSPDGSKFVNLGDHTETMHIFSTSTGEELRVIDFEWDINEIVWVENHIVGTDDASILVFDAELELQEYIEKFSKIKDSSISTLHVAKDPSKVLVNLNSADILLEFDPVTKQTKEVKRGDGFLEYIQYSKDGNTAIAVDANGLQIHDGGFKALYEVRPHGAEHVVSRSKADEGQYVVRQFSDLHPTSEKVLYNSGSGELFIGDLVSRSYSSVDRKELEVVLSAIWFNGKIAALNSLGEFVILSLDGKSVFKDLDFEEPLVEGDDEDWIDDEDDLDM